MYSAVCLCLMPEFFVSFSRVSNSSFIFSFNLRSLLEDSARSSGISSLEALCVSVLVL